MAGLLALFLSALDFCDSGRARRVAVGPDRAVGDEGEPVRVQHAKQPGTVRLLDEILDAQIAHRFNQIPSAGDQNGNAIDQLLVVPLVTQASRPICDVE